MLRKYVFCVLLLFAQTIAGHAAEPVRVGLDAEFGHLTSTADDAIRVGIEIAIDEINRAGGVLGGRSLELVLRDNHGVPARGVDNFRELAAVPGLVGVFASKFSPVAIAQVAPAHELRLPLLAPWSAADGVIDHGYRPSYSFRLSLRDGWVMPFLLEQARRRGLTKVGLLLPNGAWGRSNERAAELHAAANPVPAIVRVVSYDWSDTSLTNEYRELLDAGAQAVLVVGNEGEVALLIRDMTALPRAQWLPLLSHWGVSGGDLPALAGARFGEVDLSVVQTFSFIDNPSPRARAVLHEAMRRMGASEPGRLRSVVGIAHAYDLTQLLARAVERAGRLERAAIRDALEALGPYDGLVRHYPMPFSAERHEALAPQQLFLARYRADGALVRVRD